ncbi:hypothetical protein HN011_008571 [Eciton burchellii]|nr:hypothetical protein HN011_008571 [Eciton burchellii]
MNVDALYETRCEEIETDVNENEGKKAISIKYGNPSVAHCPRHAVFNLPAKPKTLSSVFTQTSSYDSRPVTSKRSDKPPFKLCFSKNQHIGRSDICVLKTNADFVTPKFYSRELEDTRNANVSDTLGRIAREQIRNPRDLYQSPLLTSHTYGWWHNQGIHPKDSRFNFHKKTSDLVSFQMKIYAEDRKLKSLKQ